MATSMKVQGTQLFKVATATTSIEIKNITSHNPPSPDSDELEKTDCNSTAKEFDQGLRDYGQATFDLNYDTGITGDAQGHQAMLTDFDAGTTREWIIGMSDGSGAAPTVTASAFGVPATTRSWIKFLGWVKGVPTQGTKGGLFTGTLTVRVTGQPTRYYKT